ncbi:hypothetical protein EI94DRAFT_1633304 [Lactarius quietus]|nr:hypothetical protein EI94DRAFT_1633304 [Lactarius quietus]
MFSSLYNPPDSEDDPLAGDNTTGTTPNEATYSDPSGAIFSMYITRALKLDREIVENWKGGADGILVFTGLFSSTVATFISISYPKLQQDPNVTTQSLLKEISQQLSNSNTNTNGSSPIASPSIQSSFSPSTLVVFVNSVCFLSLVLSLTCALVATLLQQWARRYLQIVRRHHPPHIRAHIREYFSRGARRFGVVGVVELLPSLLFTCPPVLRRTCRVCLPRQSHCRPYRPRSCRILLPLVYCPHRNAAHISRLSLLHSLDISHLVLRSNVQSHRLLGPPS